ncbi:MAG TPA: hypothetical protein DEH15_06330 [Marinilabiliales bacterium]|nr:hypothetical protein [Marinilabiliales bacterium]
MEISDAKSIEILKELKQNELTAHIPVILTGTESVFQNFEREISGSEADSILKFPFDELMLKLQIQPLLKLNLKLGKKIKTDSHQTEKALAPDEDKFRAVFEKSGDGILILNDQGIIVEMNHSLETITGLSKNKCIGIPLWDLQFKLVLPHDKNPELYQLLKENTEQMLESHRSKSFGMPVEQTIRNHKGQTRIIEATYYPLESVEKCFIVNVVRDITERKLFNEALKNSESKYYGIFDANKDGISIFVINSDGTVSNFVEANKAASEMLGYTKEEFLLLNVFDLELNVENHTFSERIDSLKKNKHINIETEYRHKDGRKIFVDISTVPIHYNNQIAIMNIVRDISERKKTEKTIADEQILLRTLIDNIPDLIYVKDTSGRKIISNKADLELMGFSDEKEIFGKTDQEIFDLGFAYQTYPDDLSVVKSGKPIFNKIELIKNSKGEEKYFSTSKVPLTNDSGEIIGLVGVGHDITRQRQTEQKLIQLSKGIEQSPASIIITDTKGNIEYANPKLTEITGYTFEEIAGQNPRIFQSGYTTEAEYEILWKTIREGNEYRNEIQNRKRNGELFWESVLISPIRNESGEIVNFLAIKEDISDRKKTDLQIQKLSVAIEQNPASVIITNTEGIIEYVNKKFISVSGYSFNELIGKVVRILKPGHTPDHVYIEIWNKLFAGQEWRGEHQNRTKKREKYWESVLISPIKNKEGKTTNFIILSEDISERKKMEKELITAKEKAEESDRLKSAFLANMSHEIRTPMNAIVGFSSLLKDSNFQPDKRAFFVDLITQNSQQLLAIITDIIEIATIEAGQIKTKEDKVNINAMFSFMYEQFKPKAANTGLVFSYETGLPNDNAFLITDEIKLTQILTNLISNAIKFTDQGFVKYGYMVKGSQLEFYVEDSGIGISKELHDEIFKRFRQVESSDSRQFGGSGLGLSISKSYVELLGGKIWLDSELDKGSRFYFTIPYKKTQMEVVTKNQPENEIRFEYNDHKTILVAEDEDHNYLLLQEYLSNEKIILLRAINGSEAVDICKTNPSVDMVLMDIKMPIMTGIEAAPLIKKIRPKLPIIALTAYSAESDKTKALNAGCSDFISKPVDKDHLLSKIIQWI